MRKAILIVAALSAAACSENNGWTIAQGRTPTGVPHVVNTPPAAGITPTWRIDSEVQIGSVEGGGPDSFGTIKGMVVLPDERIAVLDAQAQELRIFTADGKHQRTFGRKGAGPGEMSDANGLLLGSDGVIRVNDPDNARLSFFHPDSGFRSSVRLDVKLFGWTWRAVMDTADYIWENGIVMSADSSRYVLKGYQPDGAWTDTILLKQRLTSGPNPGVYTWERGTSRTMSTVPFWPSPVETKDPRRAYWRKPSNENDYRIARTTFSGDTTLVFESKRSALPVESSVRDSIIESLRKGAGKELDWSQIPHERPIVTQLFVAQNGDVWVRVTSEPGTATFNVFGSDGRYKGTAVAPWRFSSFIEPVVRGERFWAVILDEFDVSHVVRGQLVPFASRSRPGKSTQ